MKLGAKDGSTLFTNTFTGEDMSAITPDLRSQEVDEGYADLEASVKTRLETQKGPLFTTELSDRLFGCYLSHLPEANRQHYNCRCCGQFIQRFGGLVTLTSTGFAESAAFAPDVPSFFQKSVDAMRQEILRSRVTGVFLSSEEMLGTPQSKKGWTHLHAENRNIYRGKLLTAEQRAAELKEEYGLVQRTIQEYSLDVVTNAVTILQADIIGSEEKGRKIAEWYLKLLQDMATTRDNRRRENMVWHAVATAPPGFTHLKNGMVGTLLNDLKEGKSFTEVQASWKKKMHPLQYRRPTAPVSDGQIDAAEKVVEKLGVARSLKRRFARADELKHVIWTPKAAEPQVPLDGVFSGLKQKNPDAPGITLPVQDVTWAKFARDVLPNMRTCEINLPSHGAFMGMTSAVHMDAPPIFQWDNEASMSNPIGRNPVGYYLYHDGSSAIQWRVRSGWTTVDRICHPPHGPEVCNHQRFVFFNIEAMMDVNGNKCGSALFPSFLKAELKSIDKVVERYSNNNHLEGTGNANGYPFLGKNSVMLKVNGNALYRIDRWE